MQICTERHVIESTLLRVERHDRHDKLHVQYQLNDFCCVSKLYKNKMILSISNFSTLEVV